MDAKERKAYFMECFNELAASLLPGRTFLDLLVEMHTDPDSPLKAIMADVEAQFGSVLPPELDWPSSD